MNYSNVDCINNIQEPTRKIRASLVALSSVGTVHLTAIAI